VLSFTTYVYRSIRMASPLSSSVLSILHFLKHFTTIIFFLLSASVHQAIVVRNQCWTHVQGLHFWLPIFTAALIFLSAVMYISVRVLRFISPYSICIRCFFLCITTPRIRSFMQLLDTQSFVEISDSRGGKYKDKFFLLILRHVVW
jgi:hypothetical protein